MSNAAWRLFEDDERRSELDRFDAPELVLGSNGIVVCDPFVPVDAEPLARGVLPGRYPVDLLIHRNGRDRRVALARVRFRRAVPARWEMAVRPGQDLRTLRPGVSFGYGVDAGTGCFADPQTLAAFEGDAVEAFRERGLEDRGYTWSLGAWSHGGGNLVAFSSGYGDGIYTSWWGLDDDGEAIALITDFGVLGELDWPVPIDDSVFRSEHATWTLARLQACLQRLDRDPRGPARGEAYGAAAELRSMARDGAAVVGPLLDSIETWADSARVLDCLAVPLWALMEDVAAQTMLAKRLIGWSPALRRKILASALHHAHFKALAPELARVLLQLSAMQPDLVSTVIGVAARIRVGTEAFVELAIQSLARPDPFGRLRAGADRRQLTEEEIEHACDRLARVLAAAVQLLERAPSIPPALYDRLLALALHASDHQLSRMSGRLLAESAPERLTDGLTSPDPRVRLAAATALASHPPSRPRVAEVARALVADSSLSLEDTRFKAASLLGEPGELASAFCGLAIAGCHAALVQLDYLRNDELVCPALERVAAQAEDRRIAEAARKRLTRRRHVPPGDDSTRSSV